MQINCNDEAVLKIIGRLTIEFPELDLQNQLKVKGIVEQVLYEYEVVTKETSLVASDLEGKIQLYIACRRLEGLSEKTLANYQLQLFKFASFLHKPVASITAMDIRVFLAKCCSHKKASSTNATISILKKFFSWMQDEECIIKNPMNKIKQTKTEKRVRKALNDEEVEMLRDGCQTLRDIVLVEFLLATGCRVSEVVGIDRSHINWNEMSLNVIGKGNKERTVYFNTKTKRLLKKYIASREDSNEALFVTSKRPHGRLGVRAIQRDIARIAANGGLEKKVYPHLLRHCFGTKKLNSGMDLSVLQRIMGHSSPQTTLIYAEISTENVRHEYRKSS